MSNENEFKLKIEDCPCGCGSEIIKEGGMVFSDHTSKWMTDKEWESQFKI